jgi:Cellulase (glycosyl hydrolase family 5)
MKLITTDIRTYQRCEFVIPPPDAPGNPFDTRQIALFCDIGRPDGSTLRVPGFAYRAHKLDPVADNPKAIERALPTGPLEFRVRYAPTQVGRHTARAHFRLADGQMLFCGEVTFEAVFAPHPGYVRLGPSGYGFMTDDGSAFFPIGENICFPNSYGYRPGQKLAYLHEMMQALANAEGTAFRFWANAPYAHAIDWSSKEEEPPLRFGEINLGGCAKIDSIVESAERMGLRIMFCIDAANNWRPGDLSRSPYGIANGGPCTTTADYFNLPQARAMTREKMKYVAARWGYSPAIWCWEFWNEIDGCGMENVNSHQQLAWHQEMAQTLRAADSVQHLITTSTGHPLNFAAMWRIPEIEIVQTHHYGYHDSVHHISTILQGYHRDAVAIFGKPHIASELGVCFASDQVSWEKDGSTLHNTLWSTALLPKSCGPGFMWFWDNYVHQFNLYHHYRGIARFLRDEPWHRVTTEPLDIRAVDVPPRRFDLPTDLKLPTTLSGSDFYQSIFTVGNDGGVDNVHLIPNTYYGGDQPMYQFRATFTAGFPVAGEFIPMVWGASANCNGIVDPNATSGQPIAEIRVDGQPALQRRISTDRSASRTEPYIDRLAVPISAGPHEISLTNIGQGQFTIGHILLTHYRISEPRVSVQGLRCGSRSCFWIYNTDYQWHTTKTGQSVEPVTGMSVELRGLPTADYVVQWWDTITGEILSSDRATTDSRGTLRLRVPDFLNDIAAKTFAVS